MSRRSKNSLTPTLQPDLFSFAGYVSRSPDQHARLAPAAEVWFPPPAAPVTPVGSKPPGQTSGRATLSESALRTIDLSDMPDYPSSDQELVDRTISALPPNRMWFTYADIRESFGISRATVARRVKGGLVPGIRFKGTSVVEDGPVRRFDRGQLRWLLLAVRSRN